MRIRGHIPALDGIRGIAILMVLGFHLWKYRLHEDRVVESLIDLMLARALPSGWIGVDLFFVLSGFLITGILLDSKGKTGFFRNFYGRRVIRIMPVYYGAFAVLLVAGYLAGPTGPPALHELVETQAWYWAHLANFLFLVDSWNPVTGHFWSLALEEQFYLVWPLAVYLLSRRSLLVTCGVLIAVSFSARAWLVSQGMSTDLIFFLLPLRMGGLAAGAAVAILVRDDRALASIRRTAPAALAVAAAALGAYWMPLGFWQNDTTFILGMPIAIVFFAVVIAYVAVRPAGHIAMGLENSTLQAWGRYSYAIYLIHQPVLVLWDAPWRFVRGTEFAQRMPLLADLLCAAAISGIVFGAGLASWHLMEKHFVKLKRYFPYEQRTEGEAVRAPSVLSGGYPPPRAATDKRPTRLA